MRDNAPPPEGTSWGLLPDDPSRELPLLMSAVPPRIPRHDWLPISQRKHVYHIFDQLDGHCASNAPVAAIMVKRRMQGLQDKILAPEPLYARHSRWGTGSTLAENLQFLLNFGVPSRKSMPQRNYGSLRNYGEHSEEALTYRPIEWLDCRNDNELCPSALQLGHPLIIGTNAFGGGHSVLCTEMAFVDDQWIYGGPNSWGANWNGDGFWWYSERRLNDIGRWGTWALASVVHDEWK